jgi:FkbM family methyltransferase
MHPLRAFYRYLFRHLRGPGLGLGIFNAVHRLLWEGLLQPDSVNVEGMRLHLPVHDVGVGDALGIEGCHEPELTAAFKRQVRPGMVVVDAGANIGYYTVLASRLVGPSGRVIAFEPDAGNFSLLWRNVVENGCKNVEAYPYALGEHLVYAVLHVCPEAPGSHSLHATSEFLGPTRKVVTVAGDEVLGGSRPPDIVKMDIEGAEPEALRGMAKVLEAPGKRVLFVECHQDVLSRRGLKPDDVLEPLRARGWTISWVDSLNARCERA